MAVFPRIRESMFSAGRRAPGLLLLAGLLLIQASGASAASPAGPAEELGNRGRRTTAEPVEPWETMDLGTELSLSAGYRVFFEKDMGDTYGGMPLMMLEASLGMSETTRFVLGLGYGSRRGDPYYDSPEFEGDGDIALKALPISVGLRVNISRNPRFRLYWGASVEAVWMEEDVPDIDENTGASHRVDRGWGMGFTFSLTPEWRSADLRRALGLTFTWGGGSGEVGKGYEDHEVNLTGMGASLHYTQAL